MRTRSPEGAGGRSDSKVSGGGRRPDGPSANDEKDRLRRSTIALLAGATAIGSTGLAAGGTAGALLGAELAGAGAAGLPVGLLVIGSAAGALLISRQTGRGRRGRGLMLGYLLGAAGAAAVVAAAVARNLPLLLAGSLVLGVANSAIFLTRYAAMEAGGVSGRGRALGTVFFATAIGAALSPILLGPSGALAESAGLPRLSGLYLVAVVTFIISAMLLAAGSNPRAPWFGRGAYVLARSQEDAARAVRRGDFIAALRDSRTKVAFAAFAGTNFVMAGVMAIAPVYLVAQGRGLEAIGTMIALHVAGMFAPSPISGRLADRFGPAFVVLLGSSLLLVGCAGGMFIGDRGVVAISGHLVVIGIGWNCGIVGSSTILGTAVPGPLRPHAEGMGEVAMGLAAAVAAPVAGVVGALIDYRGFLAIGIAISACVLVVVRRSSAGRPAKSSS